MSDENDKTIDINKLSLNEKIDLSRRALRETFQSLQVLDVRGQSNLQITLKAINTIVDIDSILGLVLEDILNLENLSKESNLNLENPSKELEEKSSEKGG